MQNVLRHCLQLLKKRLFDLLVHWGKFLFVIFFKFHQFLDVTIVNSFSILLEKWEDWRGLLLFQGFKLGLVELKFVLETAVGVVIGFVLFVNILIEFHLHILENIHKLRFQQIDIMRNLFPVFLYSLIENSNVLILIDENLWEICLNIRSLVFLEHTLLTIKRWFALVIETTLESLTKFLKLFEFSSLLVWINFLYRSILYVLGQITLVDNRIILLLYHLRSAFDLLKRSLNLIFVLRLFWRKRLFTKWGKILNWFFNPWFFLLIYSAVISKAWVSSTISLWGIFVIFWYWLFLLLGLRRNSEGI